MASNECANQRVCNAIQRVCHQASIPSKENAVQRVFIQRVHHLKNMQSYEYAIQRVCITKSMQVQSLCQSKEYAIQTEYNLESMFFKGYAIQRLCHPKSTGMQSKGYPIQRVSNSVYTIKRVCCLRTIQYKSMPSKEYTIKKKTSCII